MNDRMNIKRRNFLKISGLAVVPIVATRAGAALAADAPQLSESDPTAKALGYLDDATKVNKQKFPKYKTGQICANCTNYQGKGDTGWGPCTIFPGKVVNAKGWCNAYLKKA